MSYKVNGVYTVGDEVKVKTLPGIVVTLGKKYAGTCCYGNCRMRNLCKLNHCVGKTLLDNGYRVEDGILSYEL